MAEKRESRLLEQDLNREQENPLLLYIENETTVIEVVETNKSNHNY